MKKINSILIANRGEIAIRIIKTAKMRQPALVFIRKGHVHIAMASMTLIKIV